MITTTENELNQLKKADDFTPEFLAALRDLAKEKELFDPEEFSIEQHHKIIFPNKEIIWANTERRPVPNSENSDFWIVKVLVYNKTNEFVGVKSFPIGRLRRYYTTYAMENGAVKKQEAQKCNTFDLFKDCKTTLDLVEAAAGLQFESVYETYVTGDKWDRNAKEYMALKNDAKKYTLTKL